MYPHRGNEIAHMWDCLMETVNDQDFLFCAFQVIDWNADFSPWKSPAAFGDEDFKLNGTKTLQWLIKSRLRGRQRNLSDRIFPCRIVCFMDSI